MDIVMLSRKGMSQRKIAKKLGLSRNTVKKYPENPQFPENRRIIRKRRGLLESGTLFRNLVENKLLNFKRASNNGSHKTALPLRFIAACEPVRCRAEENR